MKGSVWKEKAENLEVELQHCYKAQAQLSEQLVAEVAESRASKASVQQREATILDVQNELTKARFFFFSLLLLYVFSFSYIYCGEMLRLQGFWQMIETNVHAAGMNALS